MPKPTILTGIRANNELTIGNYFGGLMPMVEMARARSDEYIVNMFIPDLHSFTTPINHDSLYEQIIHTARVFAAAGLPLDNDSIHIYRQSFVPAHSELTWILDCFTGFGEMSRMTQFKDKSKKPDISPSKMLKDFLDELKEKDNKFDLEDRTKLLDLYNAVSDYEFSGERASVGLFNYPVLMAADILLYNAKYIPVGEDQTQHLEFTRDIAERMNARFGEIFVMPEPVSKQYGFFGKTEGLRIKDLQDPTKKMSKSDESSKGVLFLGDDPKVAASKVMAATTDSVGEVRFDKTAQPGISNLLEILALLRRQSLEQVVGEFEGETRYGDFKAVVASEVEVFLTNFQARLNGIDDSAIMAKLESSEKAMRSVAGDTLLRAQQAVGLRPRGN